MVKKHNDTQFYENRFSYSKLSSFNNCKLGYKKRYIDNEKGIGNCFSSYGTLLHSLLERYANGEISLKDLPEIYQWEFDAFVTEPFPSFKYCKNMRELYYKQGLDFLNNFQGFSDIKVLDVETKFEIPLFDWTFTGVIDFTFTRPKTDKLILRDWKSKSSFASKKEEKEYRRQLYLYCAFLKEKYGRFPDELEFFLIRKNKIVKSDFNNDDYSEALDWANNTVREIRECWVYPPSPDPFFCNQLCNHRPTCAHKA